MNKLDIKVLAEQLMFMVSEEELVAIEQDFDILRQQMALLAAIDTENVEPMIFPQERETVYLREDSVGETLSTQAVLQNATVVKDDLLVVPKVANR